MEMNKKIPFFIGVTLGVLLLAGFTTNIIRTASEDDHKCKAGDDGFCTCSTLIDAEKALENKSDWIEVDYDETTEAVKDGFYRAYLKSNIGQSNAIFVPYVMDENENVVGDFDGPGLNFSFIGTEVSFFGLDKYFRFTHTDGSNKEITENDIVVLSNVNATVDEGGSVDGYIDFYFKNADFDEEGYTGKLYLTLDTFFSNVVKLK